MTHNYRNLDGLINATKERQENASRRAQIALTYLQENNQTITVTSVAKLAKVAKSWIYRHPEFHQQILKLSSEQLKTITRKSNQTNNNKEAIINTLKKQIAQLKNENQKLKKQLEVMYGELYLKNNS